MVRAISSVRRLDNRTNPVSSIFPFTSMKRRSSDGEMDPLSRALLAELPSIVQSCGNLDFESRGKVEKLIQLWEDRSIFNRQVIQTLRASLPAPQHVHPMPFAGPPMPPPPHFIGIPPPHPHPPQMMYPHPPIMTGGHPAMVPLPALPSVGFPPHLDPSSFTIVACSSFCILSCSYGLPRHVPPSRAAGLSLATESTGTIHYS